jgi:hypothetical protein
MIDDIFENILIKPMTTESKKKLTPAQSKLVAEIQHGKELVRDCGKYWLRSPHNPDGLRMEEVSTRLVNVLLVKRILKEMGRHPGRYMDLLALDSSKV